MYTGFWFEFSILLFAAILGSLAILPYSLRLLKESKKKKPLKIPFWMLVLLSVLQNTILFAVATGIGLLIAHQIGLGAPLLEAMRVGGLSQTVMATILSALIFGIGGGSFLLLLDLLFLPHFPEKLLTTSLKTTQWENFTASFYGGINEELFTRLLGLSLIAWLLSRIWHMASGLPTASVFWIANILMAVIFALGHLPALKNLLGTITPLMFSRTIILNTPIGLLCGWIFWRYGIEAAIITHFAADIVYHVGGTLVLRIKNPHQ
jgi:hypothetical protein